MALKATPDNNYFLSIISSNLYSKEKIGAYLKDQIGAHLDDEIPNFIEEYKGSNQNKNENNSESNSIVKFFDKQLKEEYIQLIDNSCSSGFCLGSFLASYESFKKSPTIDKIFSLASLSLGCGLP